MNVLEHSLDRVRPRLLSLAADLATNGSHEIGPTPDLVAAALLTLASVANVLAVELTGEKPLR